MEVGADAYQLWTLGVEQLVRLAALVTASAIVWNKAIAPIVFRPIGRALAHGALAHGARHEAEAVVHELVDPQVEILRTGQAALEQRLDVLAEQLGQVLDRMPPNP